MLNKRKKFTLGGSYLKSDRRRINTKFYDVFDEDIFIEPETSFQKCNLQRLYQIDDSYFCIFCDNLLSNVCQMECHCRVCFECLRNHLDSNEDRCPMNTCSGVIISNLLRDQSFEHNMSQQTYKCTNRSCCDPVSLVDFYKHRRQCKYTFVKCRYCSDKVLLENKDKHDIGECALRPVESEINDRSKCLLLSGLYSLEDTIKEQRLQLRHLAHDHPFSCDKQTGNVLETLASAVDVLKRDLEFKDVNHKTNSVCYYEYTWKITEYAAKREQTANSRTKYIRSDPFFTDDVGYKMCLKAYLNGEGTGENSHLSIFVVILEGKYDALLQWPFSKRFTIDLVNQCDGNNRYVTFRPDPHMSCFQRPVTKSNVATGSPRFIGLESLSQGFINNDTLLIKLVLHNRD